MNKRLGLLAGLLVGQLLLIAALTLFQRTPDQGSGLLDFDPVAVTSLVITDADDVSVELIRTEEGWRLPDGSKVDAGKIMSVVERLAGMHSLWPVAATSSSQERFAVAPEHYQRRLEFKGDEFDAVLYLGTSPGYRRIHARNADSDEVFSIEFADHEVPAEAGEWLDKTQLQSRDISSIALAGGWTLSLADDTWLIDGVPADAETVTALVNRLQDLRLLGIFDGDSAILEEPRTLQISDAEGSYELVFRHDPEADVYIVESSRIPGRFTVASYVVEQILVEPAVLEARVDVKLSPEESETDPAAVPADVDSSGSVEGS